jgi:hypothetical protein
MTGMVAHLFADASSHSVDSGYWTLNNLERLRVQALAVMATTAAFFGYLAEKVELISTVSPILEKGTLGLYVGAVVSLFGSGWIASDVNDYITREEDALRS